MKLRIAVILTLSSFVVLSSFFVFIVVNHEDRLQPWIGVTLAIASLTVTVAQFLVYKSSPLVSLIYERVLAKTSSPPAIATVLARLAEQKGRQRNAAITLLLLAAALTASVSSFTATSSRIAIWAVPILIAAAAALDLGNVAFRYRLKQGLFGTTEYEARQIILFALSNAKDLDLSGGLGAATIELDEPTQTILESEWGAIIP